MSTDNIDINVRVKESGRGMNSLKQRFQGMLMYIKTAIAAYAAKKAFDILIKPAFDGGLARAQLDAFYGNAVKGAKAFREMQEVSLITGSSVTELQQVNKALIAIRGTAGSTKNELRALADVAEMTGENMVSFGKQYVNIMEQLRVGKVSGSALIPLIQAGAISSGQATGIAAASQAGNVAESQRLLVKAIEDASRSWSEQGDNLTSSLNKLQQALAKLGERTLGGSLANLGKVVDNLIEPNAMKRMSADVPMWQDFLSSAGLVAATIPVVASAATGVGAPGAAALETTAVAAGVKPLLAGIASMLAGPIGDIPGMAREARAGYGIDVYGGLGTETSAAEDMFNMLMPVSLKSLELISAMGAADVFSLTSSADTGSATYRRQSARANLLTESIEGTGGIASPAKLRAAKELIADINANIAEIGDNPGLQLLSAQLQKMVASLSDTVAKSEAFNQIMTESGTAVVKWTADFDGAVIDTTADSVDEMTASVMKVAKAFKWSDTAMEQFRDRLDELTRIKHVVRMQLMINDSALSIGAFRERLTDMAKGLAELRRVRDEAAADDAKADTREATDAAFRKQQAAVDKMTRRLEDYQRAIDKVRNAQQREIDIINAGKAAIDAQAAARARAERKAQEIADNEHKRKFQLRRPDLLGPGAALRQEREKRKAARQEAKDKAKFERQVARAQDAIDAGRPLSARQRQVMREFKAQRMLGGIGDEEEARRIGRKRERNEAKREKAEQRMAAIQAQQEKHDRARARNEGEALVLRREEEDIAKRREAEDLQDQQDERNAGVEQRKKDVKEATDKVQLGLLLEERANVKASLERDRTEYERLRKERSDIGDKAGVAELDKQFRDRAEAAKKQAEDLDGRIKALRQIDAAAMRTHLPNMDQTLTNIETLISSAFGAPWQGRGE